MTTNQNPISEELQNIINNPDQISTSELDLITLLEEAVSYINFLINQRQNPDARKTQVLNLLQAAPHTIQELADKLNTSTKNISSQLTYLRKDGHPICTNHIGQKFLANIE